LKAQYEKILNAKDDTGDFLVFIIIFFKIFLLMFFLLLFSIFQILENTIQLPNYTSLTTRELYRDMCFFKLA
jgi:ABC-type spermidine/putrescine transport system permease subunit I